MTSLKGGFLVCVFTKNINDYKDSKKESRHSCVAFSTSIHFDGVEGVGFA
jgi:hypothetical protein